MQQGKLIIFSAPSGSGKTTIVRHLLDINPKLGFSISATTRGRRSAIEENGKDYYFFTPEEFKQKIENGEFAEFEEVYSGIYYGTLKVEIERIWRLGKHVIFDVDVKGGLNLKKAYGDNALAVFVKIPSFEELEKRLRYRNTESEESIQTRLKKVQYEMAYEKDFDKVLINDHLSEAFKNAEKMIGDFIKL